MNLIYSRNEQSFLSKPTDEQVERFTFKKQTSPPEDLIKFLSSGQSITCPTYYRDKRKESNFIEQQIFALDFDNTITLSQIDSTCHDFSISYNFIYPTFSHTCDNLRYRVVFFCDGIITNPKITKELNKAFSLIFEDRCDQGTLDLARIWFGTNKKIIINDLEATFNPSQIFDIAKEIKYFNNGNRNKNNFKTDNILIENGGDSGNLIQYSININAISPVFAEITPTRNLIDNWSPEDLFECKLFKKFYEGGGTPALGCKLNDNELFCMASNLMLLDGGASLYLECLEKNPNYKPVKKSKISWLKNQKIYNTCLIKNSSPYQEDKDNPNQTFADILRKRGKVEIDPSYKPDLISLEVAEKKQLIENKRVYSEAGNKIYLMKGAMGIGKSDFWSNLPNVAIGFSSNSLKMEQFNNSRLSPGKKHFTPEALSKFTEETTIYLSALYNKGCSEAAYFTIKDLANGRSIFEGVPVDEKDKNVAVSYLLANKEIGKLDKDVTTFTTHSRLLFQTFNQDILVFDENAINTIIETDKTTVDELNKLINLLKFRGVNTDRIAAVLNVAHEEVHPTPNFDDFEQIIKEAVRASRLMTNISKFFVSTDYRIENGFIHYTINHVSKLPKDKKIVFLDGTGSETFYKKLFGDRLEIIDISNVINLGTIEQYTSRSASKQSLIKCIDKIAKEVGDSPVITLKHLKHHFKNPVEELHFGNLRGSNILTGKDFCMVGTYNYHPNYYRFVANTLGINCTDFRMKYMKVNYNGRIFWFQTFENPELQRLHLEQVEGELLQGVHRGRLIRTYAHVRLWSGFPLLQATYIY